MKVILLQNIKSLGNKGDIKNVADGHAMNFLIPQGLAIAASEDKIEQLQVKKEGEKIKRNKEIKDIKDIIKKISGKKIIIKKQASDKGKLFASLSTDEILTAIQKEFKVSLDNNSIKLKEHIKEVGEHDIGLEIENKKIKLKIEIIKE